MNKKISNLKEYLDSNNFGTYSKDIDNIIFASDNKCKDLFKDFYKKYSNEIKLFINEFFIENYSIEEKEGGSSIEIHFDDNSNMIKPKSKKEFNPNFPIFGYAYLLGEDRYSSIEKKFCEEKGIAPRELYDGEERVEFLKRLSTALEGYEIKLDKLFNFKIKFKDNFQGAFELVHDMKYKFGQRDCCLSFETKNDKTNPKTTMIVVSSKFCLRKDLS